MSDGRILIVEDELLFAIDLESNLENFGYQVLDKVTNGEEAIAKAREMMPDLIMMDIKLDGSLSGIETSQIIKDTLNIPVIFLTAHSDVQTIEKAKITEPFGFLLKPLRMDEVNSTIRTALHKHQIELKLKESEERFRDLTALLPQPVFELDLDYNVIFANRSFLYYFAYSDDDFLRGINFRDLFQKEEQDYVKANLSKILSGISCLNCELTTKDKYGKEKYSLFYANRIEKNGIITGIRGTITDITKRKEAEQKVLTQKLFFEAIFENSPEAIVSTDREGKIIKVNSQFEKMFGYNSKDIIDKSIDEMLAPDEYFQEARGFTQSIIEGKSRGTLETKRRRSDGKLIDTIIFGSPVILDEKVSFTIGIYIDITERKQNEYNMKIIHDLYQKTIQNALGVPYRLNLQKRKYDFIGNGVEKILGISSDDFSRGYLKEAKKEVVVHDDCDYETYHKKFLDGKLEKYQVDFKIITLEGKEKWISDSALPVFDYNEENVVESIGILQDITHRKLVEQQLRLERNKVQNYLDVAGVIFMTLDVNLNVELINKKGCDILGIEPENIIGKNWIDNFLPEKIRDKARDFYSQFKNDQIELFSEDFRRSAYFESKVETSGSEDKIILWNNILLRDSNKTITGILCSGIDITDKVRAELDIKKLNSQLKRKNQDLERIIYVTSHDLRSPLVNIEGFGEELGKDVSTILKELKKAKTTTELRENIQQIVETDIPESLNYINNSVLKIEALLSALLQLSRLGRQELVIKRLDMNELFENILSTFEYRIKRDGINLKIGNLPECVADKKQVNQLFSNLIGNALKFLSPDRQGQIEIYGRGTEKKSYYYIKDNGIGIRKEDQEKIFEIFKRIHNSNIEGEGLGLSIVRRILEKNHGDIKVESEFGQWTKFTVMLPNEEILEE
jgi:PAS domain S-box-containing protein